MGKYEQLKKDKQLSEYKESLGKQEVDSYKLHMFDSTMMGGQTESNALIARYEEQTALSEEEKAILLNNVPQPPLAADFQVMTKEQYENESCSAKRKYRNKVKSYYKARQKYYTTSVKNTSDDGSIEEMEGMGEVYARTRKEIEDRIASGASAEVKKDVKEETVTSTATKEATKTTVTDTKSKEKTIAKPPQMSADELAEKYRQQGLYPEIEEDAAAMERAYRDRMKDEAFKKAELEIGKQELKEMSAKVKDFRSGVNYYGGPYYGMINNSLRNEGKIHPLSTGLYNGMQMAKLNRDLIVRRGVKDTVTLAHMLGFEPSKAKAMKPSELKEYVQEKLDNYEDMIVSDKSYMSTSLPFATSTFSAGGSVNFPGIEFVILMKKGTKAMNIISGAKADEAEVLAAPGQKFRIVDADLSGDAEFIDGNKGSWKIYLVSENDESNTDE